METFRPSSIRLTPVTGASQSFFPIKIMDTATSLNMIIYQVALILVLLIEANNATAFVTTALSSKKSTVTTALLFFNGGGKQQSHDSNNSKRPPPPPPQEEPDLVEKIYTAFFGKPQDEPFGLKRFDSNRFPEQYPATTTDFNVAPVAGDDTERARLRSLLKNTNLEFRPLRLGYDAAQHGWDA
jgi:hypothetical protein